MDTDLYECKNSNKNRSGGFDCKAQVRIRYIDPSNQLIQTSGGHDHKRLKDDGLSTPVKQKIREQGTPLSGKTPRVMQRALQESIGGHHISKNPTFQGDEQLKEKGLTMPTLMQIQNLKSREGRKRGFTKSLTLEDLSDYYEKNRDVPGKQSS
jgi:hypothetical protein